MTTAPTASAVTRRLTAAGFSVISADRRRTYEYREGAHADEIRFLKSVSVEWEPRNSLLTSQEERETDANKQRRIAMGNAYAEELGHYYAVEVRDDGRVRLTALAEQPKTARTTPRTKDVAAALQHAGFTQAMRQTSYSGHLHGFIAWQTPTEARVVIGTETTRDGVRLSHEDATRAAMEALQADGWTVELLDRPDAFVIRVTAANRPSDSAKTRAKRARLDKDGLTAVQAEALAKLRAQGRLSVGEGYTRQTAAALIAKGFADATEQSWNKLGERSLSRVWTLLPKD